MSACQTCRTEQPGSTRYCAPKRCYCAHEDCPAFASYEELRPVTVTQIKPADDRMADAWADREEGTSWIDTL